MQQSGESPLCFPNTLGPPCWLHLHLGVFFLAVWERNVYFSQELIDLVVFPEQRFKGPALKEVDLALEISPLRNITFHLYLSVAPQFLEADSAPSSAYFQLWTGAAKEKSVWAEQTSVITACHNTGDAASIPCLAPYIVSSHPAITSHFPIQNKQTNKQTVYNTKSIISAVAKLASGSIVRGFYGDIALSWQALDVSCHLYLFLFVSEPAWAKPCSVHLGEHRIPLAHANRHIVVFY